MSEGYEVFHTETIQQSELDQMFSELPEFTQHTRGTEPMWIFTPKMTGLSGCSWIFNESTESLGPTGPMELKELESIETKLGQQPRGSIVIENSRDDLTAKNVLFLTLLLAERWPNLVVFDGSGHFYSVAECRALWEAGNGFPKED